MSEKCPKCGAEASGDSKGLYYECGSGHPGGYGTWRESDRCLRRQLAKHEAGRKAVEEMTRKD